jgi:hypothetical protein
LVYTVFNIITISISATDYASASAVCCSLAHNSYDSYATSTICSTAITYDPSCNSSAPAVHFTVAACYASCSSWWTVIIPAPTVFYTCAYAIQCTLANAGTAALCFTVTCFPISAI